MNSRRFFQILVLLTLLLGHSGANEPVRASTNMVGKLDIQNGDLNALQDPPTVTMVISPSGMNVDGIATVTVSLQNVPAEGYTSAELNCTFDPDVVETSNIVIGNLFGIDPVTAINGPHAGRFIVAIAGSDGKRAINGGAILAFNLRGLQAGQSSLECQTRVSNGDNVLTTIASTGTNVTVLGESPTPTADPIFCDQVQLVTDITVPDGTSFPPGTTFTKTWRLKNAGSCTWTTSYQLVFVSGEQMGAPASANFSVEVEPGGTIDISLNLTAPFSVGSYRGYWMFKNTNGALFGTGSQANKPWWVDIQVSGVTATATPTIQPLPCDKAEFIDDVNIPPGAVMSPGAQFTKTWRLKNVGSCTWTPSYRIALLSGDQMGAPSSIQVPVNVAPGQTVDLSLNMIAPFAAGSYRGYWIFQNSTGAPFGVGPLGNQPWFVDIGVSTTVTPTSTAAQTQSPTTTPGDLTATLTPTPSNTPSGPPATPFPGTVFDFVANACAATWFSGAGQLPCPGVDGDPKGFLLKLSHPQLETGASDSRQAILTFPQNVQDGYIQGFYPSFHVQNGDHFRSTLSCEGGATLCNVAFRLDYQIGNENIRTFWGPWLERYEGKDYLIDIDLSFLAGKDVKFILTVLSNGSPVGDRAMWVGPIIYRPNAAATSPVPSATPTPIESSTATPLPDSGMLTGQVHAGKPVTLSLYRDNAVFVTSATADTDGTFHFTIPVGTYLVFARADGFLGAEGFVTITAGNTSTMPVIRLPAGDIDGNDRIDPFDVLTIGMNYNHAFPPAADLNNDGVINVLDLELLAMNYRKAGLVPWNDFE